MNKIVRYFFSLLFLCFFFVQQTIAQNSQEKKKINKIIVSHYKKKDASGKYLHKIDTIIKLKSGDYFVLVENELGNAANFESGTYDCIEVSTFDNKYTISKGVYDISDNTGGMGMLNLTYELVYLNNSDYLVVINKNFTNHGNYNMMYIVLNAQSKLLEILLTNDYTGATTATTFNDLIKFRFENELLFDMVFNVQTALETDDNKVKIKEKTYEIKNADFDLELGCVTRIELLKTEIKTIE